MAAIFMVFVVMAMFAAMIAFGGAAKKRRDDELDALARELGGTRPSHAPSVVIPVGGLSVTLELITRGAGSSAERWTSLRCALPTGYPFWLHLVEHAWLDRGRIERGEMIDVQVGDDAFDAKFRVEGAPADVIRRVLEPEMRAWLFAQRGIELDTTDGKATLQVMGWITNARDAQPAVDLLARFVSGVRHATHAIEQQLPAAVPSGSAYREEVSDRPLQEARAARAAEVAQVAAVVAARKEGQRVLQWAILLGFLVVLMLGAVCTVAANS